jgi:hypothetical protein
MNKRSARKQQQRRNPRRSVVDEEKQERGGGRRRLGMRTTKSTVAFIGRAVPALRIIRCKPILGSWQAYRVRLV